MPYFCHPAELLSPFCRKHNFIRKRIFLQKHLRHASFCIIKPKLYILSLMFGSFSV